MPLILVLLMALSVVSCGDKHNNSTRELQDKSTATNVIDVGKVGQVEVDAMGAGSSPSAAIVEALKNAISQVNGISIDASTATINASANAIAQVDLDSQNGKDTKKAIERIQSQAFAEAVVSQSNGVVTSFKVRKITAPNGEMATYTAAVTAKVAKFIQSDSGKIKIVVTPLIYARDVINIAGKQFPPSEVLDPIQQKIINSLTEGGRFTVLDCNFDNSISDELRRISDGTSNKNDLGKLGNNLSADIISVTSINHISYDKYIKKLQTTNMELVGLSGKWSITEKLINLTTRQVLSSNTIDGEFPSILPTSIGHELDESSTILHAQSEIARRVVDSINSKIFPITVVKIDGAVVVLSQGEGSVSIGDRYKVVLLGQEIRDPQTGQSLGSLESDCCEVTINRIGRGLSYGQLDNVKIRINNDNYSKLRIRDRLDLIQKNTAHAVTQKESNSPTQSPQKEPRSPASENNDRDW